MAQEHHQLVKLKSKKLSFEEGQDAKRDSEQAFVALKEIDIKYTWRHIERQVICEHCDEPVWGINVRWDLLASQMLVQIRQVYLCQNLELVTEDSECAFREEVEYLSEPVLA